MLKDKDKTEIFKDEKVKDRIYPEDLIEDGRKPEQEVKDEINKEYDNILNSNDPKEDSKEEREEAMYPDGSGDPMI